MRIDNPLINKGIDYILNHIDEEISLEDVASYCNFSKYYFSRLFKSETGVSVYSFIKTMKMDQSAVSLKVEKEKSITDIGCDYGYSSSNYSSAFTKEYSVCPADFRKESHSESIDYPFYDHANVPFKSFDYYEEHITVKDLPDFNVKYERYFGDYSEIGQNWGSLIERNKELFDKDTLMIEKSYNDPSISSFDKSVYDLCITVKKDNSTVLKGRKFAVYTYEGYIKDIFVNFLGMFNVWLPKVSYERDDRYVLGIYKSIDWEKGYVVMDLCVPIK